MREIADVPYDFLLRDAQVLVGDPAQGRVEERTIGIRGERIELLPGDLPEPLPAAHRTLRLPRHLITPGFVNVHTHALLCLLRGVSEDMGFAPAYTRGVPHGHEIRPSEAVALARLGALEALLFGSTLINDSYVHAEETLPAMSEVGLRVYACGRVHDVDFTRLHEGLWEHQSVIGERSLGEALRLAERWHGGADAMTGVQIVPHAPDTCSADLLRLVRQARDATGLRVSTHLAQTPIEVERVRGRDGMSPVELLQEIGLLDERLTAAHCIFVDDADISRIASSGASVAHAAKVNAIGGYRAPTSALRRAGAPIALATDAMHMDMIESMRWALANGRVQEGCVSEFWQPSHVVAMATAAGARAMGLGGEIGRVETGYRADLVAVNLDRPHVRPVRSPLGSLVHTAQGRDVAHVFVNGQHAVDAGVATRVDSERVVRDAEDAARALWSRCAAA